MKVLLSALTTVVACTAIASAASPRDAAPTLDQLILKGTHNSYSCLGGDSPSMFHPPAAQVDDFGVWALEFDIGAIPEEGGSAIAIGHDRVGDATCLHTTAP